LEQLISNPSWIFHFYQWVILGSVAIELVAIMPQDLEKLSFEAVGS
jgi:hypothetical protein